MLLSSSENPILAGLIEEANYNPWTLVLEGGHRASSQNIVALFRNVK